MSTPTPREQLDTLLGNVAKVAGPASPYIEIARAVTTTILGLIEAGVTAPAEIRRRLADGIQRGDVVSDEALAEARVATELVDDYLGSLDP